MSKFINIYTQIKHKAVYFINTLTAAGLVHTLIADNAKEFAEHEAIVQALSCNFYFADPYAFW